MSNADIKAEEFVVTCSEMIAASNDIAEKYGSIIEQNKNNICKELLPYAQRQLQAMKAWLEAEYRSEIVENLKAGLRNLEEGVAEMQRNAAAA